VKIAIQVVVSFLLATTLLVREAASADLWCSIRADSPKCVFQAGCEKLDTAQRCACQWGLMEQAFAETELPFVAKLTALYAAKDEQAAVLLGAKLGVDKMMEFSGKLAMIDQMTPSKCGPGRAQPAAPAPPAQPKAEAPAPEKWQPSSKATQADIALETVAYLLFGPPKYPFKIETSSRTLTGWNDNREITVEEIGHCRYRAENKWLAAGITERYSFDLAGKRYAMRGVLVKRGHYNQRALSVQGIKACLAQDTKEALGNQHLQPGACANSFNFFGSLDDPYQTTLPALNYVMLYHCSPPASVVQSEAPLKPARPQINWKPASIDPRTAAVEAVAFLVGGVRTDRGAWKGDALSVVTPEHAISVREAGKCTYQIIETFAGKRDDYTLRIASANWATQAGMFDTETGPQPGLFVKGIEVLSSGQQVGGNPHIRRNVATDEIVFYGFGENPETLLHVFDFLGNGYCKGQPDD
jgi:hypothetical protein